MLYQLSYTHHARVPNVLGGPHAREVYRAASCLAHQFSLGTVPVSAPWW